MNGDFCAVRFDGKVQLHVLEGEGHVDADDKEEDRESRMFPEAVLTTLFHECVSVKWSFLGQE